jgi:hypothetical protein
VNGDIWKARNKCVILEVWLHHTYDVLVLMFPVHMHQEDNEAIQALLLQIRDKETDPENYVHLVNRLWSLVCELVLCELPDEEVRRHFLTLLYAFICISIRSS